MMRLQLSALCAATDGRLAGDDVIVTGLCHDSRQVEPGDLFVALPGEHADGHDFVAAAAAAGASAAVVDRMLEVDLPQLLVEDPQLAMGRIAAHWRAGLDLSLVGITGSNGKTTDKEMVTAILSACAPTLATRGNYNNEIGMPLTLARLDALHRFAVIEMGASGPGDIRYLAELARPDVGLVNNAGPAHLEGFGSLEGVARTKGEMYSALAPGKTAVINADDAFFNLWWDMASHCQRLTFGSSSRADIRADLSGSVAGQAITVHTPAGQAELNLPLPGRHNRMNALAALAIGHALEVPLDQAVAALERMQALPGRLQPHRHADGWQLIDDSYNANPASLYAGLQVVTGMPGQAWLVLGDMAELGEDAARLHGEMGQAAADLGVRRLLTIGPLSRQASLAFGPGGEHFDSHDALAAALREGLKTGINCLVKGSRSMAMERVVRSLIEPGDEPC